MSEHDPTGRGQHDPGAKVDAGKIRPGLVLGAFSRALTEVTKIGTHGAEKYSDNGWLSVPNGQARYHDAMLRHVLKESTGERVDPDFGLLHAAHTAWNALAVLELKLRDQEAAQIARGAKTPNYEFPEEMCAIERYSRTVLGDVSHGTRVE